MTVRRSSDTQAWVSDTITDREGGDLGFEAEVTLGSESVPAEWVGEQWTEGPAGFTRRTLRFNVAGLTPLLYTPWLANPNGPDLRLDPVNVVP